MRLAGGCETGGADGRAEGGTDACAGGCDGCIGGCDGYRWVCCTGGTEGGGTEGGCTAEGIVFAVGGADATLGGMCIGAVVVCPGGGGGGGGSGCVTGPRSVPGGGGGGGTERSDCGDGPLPELRCPSAPNAPDSDAGSGSSGFVDSAVSVDGAKGDEANGEGT